MSPKLHAEKPGKVLSGKRAEIARRDAQNAETARIALSDPEKYPGVMQEWACLVLADRHVDYSLNKPARAPSKSIYPTLPGMGDEEGI